MHDNNDDVIVLNQLRLRERLLERVRFELLELFGDLSLEDVEAWRQHELARSRVEEIIKIIEDDKG